MGAFLEKPITDKATADGEGCGLRYGVAAMQGWRKEMEDQHVCENNFKLENHSFFGVFDGHAGASASKYCSDEMLKTVLESHEKAGALLDTDSLKSAIHKGFLLLDQRLAETPAFANESNRGGTTAITVMVTPTHIIWGNCGDSRGLYCRDGQLHFSTEDHKPFNDKERSRIEKAGGTVMMQRVNGSLAVSRALGDFEFKGNKDLPAVDQLVSPEPEVTVLKRDDGDYWLLLACDGIYDVLSNEDIIDFVNRQLKLKNDLSKICSDLLDWCLAKNSRDNMSVILVTFPNAPTVSQEDITKEEGLEKDLRENIETTIKEIAKDARDPLDLDEAAVWERLTVDVSQAEHFRYSMQKTFISEKVTEAKKERFGDQEEEYGERDFGNAYAPQLESDLISAFATSDNALVTDPSSTSDSPQVKTDIQPPCDP